MQTTKRSGKYRLPVFILILVMIMALLQLSASAYKDTDFLRGDGLPPSGDSTYLVSEPTASTSIDVTLIMEAGDEIFYGGGAFREELSVQLTSTPAKAFTVSDLLLEADGMSGLTFNFSSSDYLISVEHGGYEWEAGQLGLDGWSFRVNDKFPVTEISDPILGDGYMGTDILETYIEDGDVVHFFYDFPAEIERDGHDYAAYYVSGILESYTSSQLTAQLEGHKTFIDQAYDPNDPPMWVYEYEDLGGGITASLFELDGTPVGTASVSLSNGQVSFTGNFSTGQTYILTTESELFSGDPDWDWLTDDVYFAYTGAYSYITI